jgi:hypothetical protein
MSLWLFADLFKYSYKEHLSVLLGAFRVDLRQLLIMILIISEDSHRYFVSIRRDETQAQEQLSGLAISE